MVWSVAGGESEQADLDVAEIISMAVPNVLITVPFTARYDGGVKQNGRPDGHSPSNLSNSA